MKTSSLFSKKQASPYKPTYQRSRPAAGKQSSPVKTTRRTEYQSVLCPDLDVVNASSKKLSNRYLDVIEETSFDQSPSKARDEMRVVYRGCQAKGLTGSVLVGRR